jgi:hypothetical protein
MDAGIAQLLRITMGATLAVLRPYRATALITEHLAESFVENHFADASVDDHLAEVILRRN